MRRDSQRQPLPFPTPFCFYLAREPLNVVSLRLMLHYQNFINASLYTPRALLTVILMTRNSSAFLLRYYYYKKKKIIFNGAGFFLNIHRIVEIKMGERDQ